MSYMLKDWIIPKIRIDLRDAVALRTQQPEEGQCGRRATEWQADGKLVLYSTQGQCVQLVEFISFRKPPYSAWVSDSYTRIRANFSTAATDAYKREAHQAFPVGTVGSILEISEFYLRVNSAEPSSKRVTLTIHKFKRKGMEGSSTFGLPRDAEEAREVQAFFGDILALSPTLHSRGERATDSPSPIRSQAGSISDGGHNQTRPLATQAPFASNSVIIPSKTINFGDQSNSRDEPHFLEPDNKKLLDLLSNNRTKDNSMPKPIASNSDDQNLLFCNMFLRPVDESRRTEKASRLHSKANIQKSAQVAMQHPSKDADSSSNSQLFIDHVEKYQMIQADDPNDSEKENSQHRMGSSPAVYTESRIVIPQTQQAEEKPLAQRAGLDCNNWGCRRVPRKYVQIPKDQLILLERDESWYSAGATETLSTVNVPANVLLGLQTFYDRITNPKSYGDNLQNNAMTEDNSESTDSDDSCVTNSSRASNHSAGMNRRLRLVSPKQDSGTLDLYREGEEIRESVSDKDAFSCQSSSAGDRLPALSPQIRHGSPSCFELAPTIDLGDSTKWRHQEAVHRSVSPSPSRANDTDFPESLDAISALERHSNMDNGSTTISRQSLQIAECASQVLSSSPLEMEFAIPDGIDEHCSSSLDDVEMVGEDHRTETISSTDRRMISNLQVVRTPHVQPNLLPSSVTSNKFAHRGGTSERRQMDNLLAHSVIPGTIGSASLDYPTITDFSRIDSLFSHKPTEDDCNPFLQRSSARSSLALSSTSREDYDDDRLEPSNEQLLAGYLSYSQSGSRVHRNEDVGKILDTSLHPDNIQGMERLDMSGMNMLLERVSDAKDALEPATQLLPNEDSRLRDLFQGELNISTTANIENWTLDRPSQQSGLDFEFSQEGRQIVNTAEMVRANRLDFQRRLSRQAFAYDTKKHAPQLATRSAHSFGSDIQKPLPYNSSHADGLALPLPMGNNSTILSIPDRFSRFLRDIHDLDNPVDSIPNGYDTNEILVDIDRSEIKVATLSSGTSTKGLDWHQNKMSAAGLKEGNISKSPPQPHGHSSDEVESFSEVDSHFDEVDSNSEVDGNSGEDSPTLLDRFRSTYPIYVASERKFVKACAYLEWLKCDKKVAPHPSLWDDFIRAWCDEYLDYIRKCKPGEKKMSGIDFYNEHVPEPKFTKRIITSNNIQEALSLDPEETERARALFRKPSTLGAGHDLISAISSQFLVLSPESEIYGHENAQEHQPRNLSDDSKIQSQGANSTDSPPPLPKGRVRKNPFFETSSQLVSRNQHIANDASPLSLFERTRNPCELQMTVPQSSQRNARRLPWTYSPSIAPISSPPNDERQTPAFDSPSIVANHAKGQYERHSTIPKKPILQHWGSPNLGSKEAEKPVTVAVVSEGSPILGTRVFPTVDTQQSDFKTSSVLASKLEPRRTTSLPEHNPNTFRKDNDMFNSDDSVLSVPAKRKASPSASAPPKKRPTWSEFCKSWVARKTVQAPCQRLPAALKETVFQD